jgi:hypothetical protein
VIKRGFEIFERTEIISRTGSPARDWVENLDRLDLL